MNTEHIALGGLVAFGLYAVSQAEQSSETTTTAETTNTSDSGSTSTSTVEKLADETTQTKDASLSIEEQKQNLIGSTIEANGNKVKVLDAEYRPERSNVSPWRVKVKHVEEVKSHLSDRWTHDTGDTYWTQTMAQ